MGARTTKASASHRSTPRSRGTSTRPPPPRIRQPRRYPPAPGCAAPQNQSIPPPPPASAPTTSGPASACSPSLHFRARGHRHDSFCPHGRGSLVPSLRCPKTCLDLVQRRAIRIAHAFSCRRLPSTDLAPGRPRLARDHRDRRGLLPDYRDRRDQPDQSSSCRLFRQPRVPISPTQARQEPIQPPPRAHLPQGIPRPVPRIPSWWPEASCRAPSPGSRESQGSWPRLLRVRACRAAVARRHGPMAGVTDRRSWRCPEAPRGSEQLEFACALDGLVPARDVQPGVDRLGVGVDRME